MKRISIVFTVVLIALAFGFTACQKDNTDSSALNNSTLDIRLQALNKSFSMPVVAVGTKSASLVTASIVWDTARMVVSTVKFEAKLKSVITRHDSIEIDYKWTGPKEINLLDSIITVGNFTLQPGYYDEIEIKVDGFRQDAGNKPVFYLHGVYIKDLLTTLPVIVKVKEDVVFKTEKDSVDITVADPAFTSVIQLYLDQLMYQIPLSDLDNAKLTNGAIVISADTNTELYGIIMRNLRKDHHSEHHKEHGDNHDD